MSDEHARPRSMADLVVEQATAAPGETRETPRRDPEPLTVSVSIPSIDFLDVFTDDALGAMLRAAFRKQAEQ